MAALLAAYGAQPAVPFTAAPEEIITIRPPSSLFRKEGRAAFTATTNEKKLTSKCSFHAERGVSSPIRHKGSSLAALRISPSILPNVFSVKAMASFTACSFDLSDVNDQYCVDVATFNLKLERIRTRHTPRLEELLTQFPVESVPVF